MDELTDIDGIGSSTAEELAEEGYDSVESIADADPDVLADVEGFGPERASEVIEAAANELESDESEVNEEEKRAVVDDTVHDESDEDEDEDETVTVEYEIDSDVFYHVLGAVNDEATRLHQRNDIQARDAAYELQDEIMTDYVESNDGETVAVELDVTMEDLNILQRGLSATGSEYRSMSGITTMYADLLNLKDEVGADRSANWGL